MAKFLIDTSVFHHAEAVSGKWQSAGMALWGGRHPVDTGRLVSVETPKYIRPCKGGAQARFIAAIADSIRKGSHSGETTDALLCERLHLNTKSGRYGDMNLFAGIQLNTVQTLPEFTSAIPVDQPLEALRIHLRTRYDPFYLSARKALHSVAPAKDQSQDAWHIRCAQVLGYDAFITCDTTLLGNLRSIASKRLRSKLLNVVKLPSEVCEIFGIEPWSDETMQTHIREHGFP